MSRASGSIPLECWSIGVLGSGLGYWSTGVLEKLFPHSSMLFPSPGFWFHSNYIPLGFRVLDLKKDERPTVNIEYRFFTTVL